MELIWTAAILDEDGSYWLGKIVHNPLNESVLFWWRKSDESYVKKAGKYASINQIFPVEDVISYHKEQAKRQVLLSSKQLKTGAISGTEAVNAIEPYASQKLMERIWFPLMGKQFSYDAESKADHLHVSHQVLLTSLDLAEKLLLRLSNIVIVSAMTKPPETC